MGCPKRFSLQAGMGAGLLSKVETATAVRRLFCYAVGWSLTVVVAVTEQIIKALRRNLNVPVTCKIRLLETTAKTVCSTAAIRFHASCSRSTDLCLVFTPAVHTQVDYMRAMEAAGAQAIGVHARFVHSCRGVCQLIVWWTSQRVCVAVCRNRHIEDRPRHPAHYDLLREVAPCVKVRCDDAWWC